MDTSQAIEGRPSDDGSATRQEIAILFENATPDFAEVAIRLRESLSPKLYHSTMAAIDSDDASPILDTLRNRSEVYVVAIGLPAGRVARDELSAPIVFAQVFNYQELLVEGRAVRGVSALPPFALQAEEWKRLDPGLQRVALIVSEHHPDLIREAEEAAQTAGLSLEQATSRSDRETLYVFKRLTSQIDGLWLVPDDRILSPPVLREMLEYAASHGVRVTVFSDALLSWGALLSATSNVADVARTVRSVLESMIAGVDAPVIVPLSEMKIRVNRHVADRLGISPSPVESWTARTP